MKLNLNGVWNAESIPTPGQQALKFSGSVPGSVINDLIHADILPRDIFWRDNAEAVRAFETYSWHYSRAFTLDAVPAADTALVFSQLDTYCDVYVNGSHVGSTDNGHIPHRFIAGHLLHTGENTIDVYLASPITKVAGKKKRSGAFTTERMNTRRMQCTYGWDWTMRFVTCGIGEVWLEQPDELPIAVDSVYVWTKCVEDTSAALGMDIRFGLRPNQGARVGFTITDEEGRIVWSDDRYCAEPRLMLNADIPQPNLWFPLGYGKQPLYRLTIRTGDVVLSETVFGIRTVRVEQLPDEPGSENYAKCVELKKTPHSQAYDNNTKFSGFILKINGVKILCRGQNWVPCEPFVTEGMDEKITAILETAALAGVNMLRVWGGGSFERAHFYNECSRLGILVTQDFLMACGHYPEDEHWFIESLRREAEYAALLIRNQPCLVWWSGDNENAVNGCDTDVDYTGRRSAYQGIAPVLYELDPNRPFFASSPYGGDKYASNTVGTTHNTQYLSFFFQWLEKGGLTDYKEYLRTYNARFIAEEPTMGAVCRDSMRRMMTDGDITGCDTAMWLYHTQSNPALRHELFDYADMFAKAILGDYTDGEDAYFKRKYIQHEWMRVSLERVRREMWFCSGIVFWMLADCWPAASGWTIIDYYGVPKDSFYTFRRLAAHTVISIDHLDGRLSVWASNDTANRPASTLQLAIVGAKGVRELESVQVTLPGEGSAVVHSLPRDLLGEGETLVATLETADGQRDRTFWREGKLPIVPCPDGLRVNMGEGSVTITAERYVHAVELEGEALLEDSCFSMLPGETRTIAFRPLPGREKCGDVRVTAYTIE